jgi:hypothetical protein
MAHGFDTELLIEAAKKFKEIWDTKCEKSSVDEDL